ncbi:hypothetical protein BS50DRAFT_413426 [Corynespora cassiicola Philippines]|uniref:Secreted protein n=1 Tax=Corynespora cassiicola Philippines TaxID=1448308 RepID=A0A2T2NLR7_CORCC|nr:hypothetical protein BS50DRAFT_413426 [Corynespora cassiicola Philippines]
MACVHYLLTASLLLSRLLACRPDQDHPSSRPTPVNLWNQTLPANRPVAVGCCTDWLRLGWLTSGTAVQRMAPLASARRPHSIPDPSPFLARQSLDSGTQPARANSLGL